MEREQFVREHQELAAEQNREGNKNIWRVIGIITVGVSAIIGTQKYCNDDEFRNLVNEKIYQIYYNTLPG